MAWNFYFTQLRPILFKRPIITQIIVLGIIDAAINWKLFADFFDYVSWGNFLVPFAASQYPSGPALIWNPFQYGGSPGGLGFAVVSNYFVALGPLALFTSAFGPVDAAKFYILLSTLWLGFSAVLFARTLIRHPIGQLVTAVFVMAGPFQLALYGQGDFEQFVCEGLMFLSLYFLWLGVNRPSQRWLWLPLAAWSIVLAFQSPQSFLLGLILLACMLPVYLRAWLTRLPDNSKPVRGPLWTAQPKSQIKLNENAPRHWWSKRTGEDRRSFLTQLGFLMLRVPALVAVAAVIIIPSYVTFYVLGNGAIGLSSVSALPLSTFAAYSLGPISLLTLSSYYDLSANMVVSGAGAGVALAAWELGVLALLVLIWISYFVTRDRRLLYFLFLSVAFAMIGAGPSGPFAGFSIFLYLRFPAYAAINASYYWDWFVIVPLYALMLGILVEWSAGHLGSGAVKASGPSVVSMDKSSRQQFNSYRSFKKAIPPIVDAKGPAVGAVLLLVVVVIIPIANGGYYAVPNGMHQVAYPQEYDQIPNLLKHLIGNGYAGVALFNPDDDWFLFNSTHPVPNAFFLFANVRTSGLPYYLAPPYQSNYFSYWLYTEFYSNSTRYAGELFAQAGVEYFLVFYGSQSASDYPYFLQSSYGKNASELLKFQEEIVPVIQERYFSIYRNLAFNGVAFADSSLSLIAGPGYDELNALAYTGIGLSNQSWLFPSDLTANDCSTILQRVERVYTANPNALTGIALQCDHVAVANPVLYTSPSASPSVDWVPSTNTLGIPIVDSWPDPLAVTDGDQATLSVSLKFSDCIENCRIWLPVRLSGDGGALSFGWGGATWSLSTDSGFDGLNNTMVWVQLPFTVTSSGGLSIKSMGGWNAVGSIFVFGANQSSQITSVSDWINRTLVKDKIFQVSPASLVNVHPVSAVSDSLGYLSNLPSHAVNSVPGNQGIIASNFGSGPVSISLPIVKPASPGWIALLVRATAYVYFSVSLQGSRQPELVGFDSGDYNSSHNYWQAIMVPWNDSQPNLESSLTLDILRGTLWLAEAWFVPESVPGSLAPTPTALPSYGIPTLFWSSNVSISNWSTRVSTTGMLSISVNGTFGPATSFDQFLMNFRFANPAPPGTALAISVNVTPGLWISVNGAVVSYRSWGSFTMFGSLFQNSVVFPSSNVTFDINSYEAFPSKNNSFEVQARFAFIRLPLVWNVTDFAVGLPLQISADGSGYQVSTNGSNLILVRVEDYAGLAASGHAEIEPALGTLSTLIWTSSNQSEIMVSPSAIEFFYIGIAVSSISFAVWIGTELWVKRRASRERSRNPKG
jgi:hypothetical protein